MTIRRRIAALSALLPLCTTAQAQSPDTPSTSTTPAPAAAMTGTLMTHAEGLASNGKPVGCRLTFKASAIDGNRNPPTTVYVAGNLAVSAMLDGKPSGSIGVGLVMRDMTDEMGRLRPRPATIASVALIGADGLSNEKSLRASQPGSEPGSRISLFQLEGPVLSSVLRRMATEHELMLSIHRTEGGPDLRVVIDVSMIEWNAVSPRRGSQNITAFTGCVDTLMAAMSALAAKQRGQ